MRIITFGTFDLFHVGHLNILNKAKYLNELNNYLIVGVSTDYLNFNKKQKYPIIFQNDRLEIVKNIKFVDEVFFEESLDLKKKYIEHYHADILVMGNDWCGKFDNLSDICKVHYLPRTENISTTKIISLIKKG